LTPASTAGVLTANSAGRFPIGFFNPALSYKAILKDSAGATITTINPIYVAADYLDSSDLVGYLTQAGGGQMTGPLNQAEGAAIASATTVDLDAATGNMIHITGTTTITGMTLAAGRHRWLVFDGALILTHSANLILPGSANITTVAGDMALVIGEGSGVTRMFLYTLANGKPLIEPAEWLVSVGDETTAITVGTAKRTFRAPHALTLDAIPRGSLTAASSSGAVQVDINKNSTTIFTTELTIDQSETTSETAVAPSVLDGTITFADNDQITIDIVAAGATAAGLKVLLRGYRRNRS
jgi:hypothetical protein